MGEEWCGGAKSFIQDQLKWHPFPVRIIAKATSMIHSKMFHRLDNSTFYFYEPGLFQIFVPWSDFRPLEIYKNLGFTLSTSTFIVNNHTDITSMNIFICFKYYTVWTQFFFIKIHVKVFYIYIWFKCEAPLLFFQSTEKNTF